MRIQPATSTIGTHYPRVRRWLAALLAVIAALAVTLGFGGAASADARLAAGAAVGGVPLVFSSFRDGNSELYAVQPDGTGLKRLTTHNALDAFPSLSPDGSRVAFVSTRHGNSELYAMNLDGTGLVRLTSHAAIDAEPDWSPDGTRIAFTSSRTGNGDIYTASSSDGSGLARLTNHTAIDVSPAWSPVGTQLAFVSLRSGLGDVYRMQSNGSAPTRLTSSLAPDLFPLWSPDGSKLAFASLRSGNSDIYTMNPDGSQQTRRTQSAAIESEPAWSPDGSKLAISSNAPGKLNFDLYLLNADGTGATPLAPHARLDASPDWAHGAAGPPPFNGTVTPVVDTPGAVTATIGPSGGTVSAGTLTLTIPAGALTRQVAITVTPLSGIAGTPLDGGFLGGAQLEPNGLAFVTPATLTFTLPSGTSSAGVVGFGFTGGGTDFHLVPPGVTGPTLSVLVSHFTGAGWAVPTLAQLQNTLSYLPTPGQAQAEQAIVAALNDPALTPAARDAAIAAALRSWYQHSVSQGLQVAVGRQLEFFELAVGEWLAWLSFVQEYGVGPALATEQSIAMQQALLGAKDQARRLLDQCTGGGSDPAAPLRLVLRLAASLDLFEAPIEGGSSGLPLVVDLGTSCMHVVIERVAHAPAFAIDRDNSFEVDAGVAFWNGPVPVSHSIPLTLRLGDTTGGAPVPVAADSVVNGQWRTTVQLSNEGFHTLELEVELVNADEVLRAVSATQGLTVTVRDRIQLEALGSVAISPGGSVTLRVRVAGDGMAGATVDYSSQGIGSLGASSGTTNEQGEAPVFVYTAPSDPASGDATITAAFGDATDSVAITVAPDGQIAVTVSPATVTLGPGQTQQFSATFTGTPNSAVTWSETGGSIDANGLYTAGSATGNFTVTATSVEDPAQSGSATVTIVLGTVTLVSRSGGASGSATACGGTPNPTPSDPDQLTGNCSEIQGFNAGPENGTLAPFAVSGGVSAFGPGEFTGAASAAASSSVTALNSSPSTWNLSVAAVVSATASGPTGGNIGQASQSDARTSSRVVFQIDEEALRYHLEASVTGGCQLRLFQLGTGLTIFELPTSSPSPTDGVLEPGRYELVTSCFATAPPGANFTTGSVSVTLRIEP